MVSKREFLMRGRMALVVVACSTLGTACATVQHAYGVIVDKEVEVTVNALAAPGQTTTASYVVVPGMEGVTPGDLQFREFYPIVSRALEAQGFRVANGSMPPEIAVFLSYGVGTPRVVYQRGYVMSSGSTSTSQVTMNVGAPGEMPATASGTVQTSTPGELQLVSRAATVMPRFAMLVAVDAKTLLQEKRIVELWRTQMSSLGESADIRAMFPVLLAAGQPFFGTSSGKEVHKKLVPTDPTVKALTGAR